MLGRLPTTTDVTTTMMNLQDDGVMSPGMAFTCLIFAVVLSSRKKEDPSSPKAMRIYTGTLLNARPGSPSHPIRRQRPAVHAR